MYLKEIATKDTCFESTLSLELVADDLILCSIINTSEYMSSPTCYWRLTDTYDVPPLEVQINPVTGILQSITIFISDEFFHNLKHLYYH